MREAVTALSRIDGMLESVAPETLAVRRRRESRREEATEQTKLVEMLTRYLDPSCTFWTSLENNPISAVSGMLQKRRGVRSGLPDILVLFRHDTGTIVIFIELKSRRGVASNAEADPSGAAAVRRDLVDGAKRTCSADGVAPLRRDLPAQMEAAAPQTVGRTVRRSNQTIAAASARGRRATGGAPAMAEASARPLCDSASCRPTSCGDADRAQKSAG